MPTSLIPTQFGIRPNFPFFDRFRERSGLLDRRSFPGIDQLLRPPLPIGTFAAAKTL